MKYRYENCISLGWLCGTAGSMAKYGLRGFSGPFDWYFSDYSSVIEHIRTGFTDFLNRDNLVPKPDAPKRFLDTKYGFEYIHDIETNLDDDYDSIFEKYRRRTDRFKNAIKEPTMFLRTVRDEEEWRYIVLNNDKINQVLKEYNRLNEVIYLYADKIKPFPEEIKSFPLNIEDYKFDPASVRDLFDNSSDLISFLGDTFPEEKRNRNKEFDSACNDACASDVYHMINKNNPEVFRTVLQLLDTNKDEGIYLWGCGFHGRAMYDYLKDNGVFVKGIIDTKRAGEEYKDHRILIPGEVKDHFKIFIAVASKESTDIIKDELNEKFCNIKTADYYDLKRAL